MRQQFFIDTIQSRFIKALLYNTPLPRYNTVANGTYVIKGCYYIYKRHVIKCTQTGIFLQDARWEEVCEYDFGKYYPQFTERYVSKYNYYDSETHRWLGDYLRCYRDIYDVNLMPFYNCFSGEYFPGLRITNVGVYEDASLNPTHKIVKVPVKFNTTYTIALDCLSSVYVAPALLANGSLVKVPITEDESDLTLIVDSFEGNVKRFDSMSFTSPRTYKITNTNKASADFFQKYEKDLYMLIQIPDDNASSIVVLEGDYTNTNTFKVFSVDMIEELTEAQKNDMMLSNLSLLKFSDKRRYPFSDRLIEYLLQNVVTEVDEVGNNVKFAEEYLKDPGSAIVPTGIWTASIRKTLFDKYYKDNRLSNIDITGNIDKDVERMILRGNNY